MWPLRSAATASALRISRKNKDLAKLTRSLGRFSAIWIATVILFAVSPLIAPGSLSHTALISMLPFAAILAIVGFCAILFTFLGVNLLLPGLHTYTSLSG